MEFLAVNSFLKVILGFGPWSAGLIIALYFALVINATYRTGSSYFFIDKIWKLTGGEKEFKNKNINAIWSDIKDVEAFRFRTKIKVSTLEQIERVDEFLKKNGMGFHDIIPFVKYFDIEKMKLKEIKYWRWMMASLLAVIVSYILICVPVFFTSFTSFDYNKTAYITLEKSGRNIYLQKNQALIEGDLIDAEDCTQKTYLDLSEKYNITESEVKSLCKELISVNPTYYKKVINEQRILVFLWTLLFFVSMIFFAKKSYVFSRAIDFKKKIDSSLKKKIKVKLIVSP